ncbi:molybdopterin synthase subunit MoaE [Nakamurella panacisegetis]|uniref:Molybdopterin synthase subunit MoaE n=1 Tax=Nakamurella panacisegetis TaxID=1090615 RepID=A0A1H0J6Y0_9ACTN|nr:molybdenum cofactor biosynthesis protein MoaE [Nakamurella panacisegetis]SDO39496.1 molybdopterin synthase subunit MoaE [Nakamurella panacisegetis]
MGRVALAGVSSDALDLTAHHDAVQDRAAGATVTFAGVVRDHDHGESVTELEYQVHPTAAAVVARVAADLADRDGVIAVAVTHRYGLLGVGDIALAAAVSAAHRQEAFDACSDLVEEVKRRLPVWKRQVFTDGRDEWVGSA